MPHDTFTYYLLKVGFMPPLRAHLVLRENGVENVVVVGTKTNCCIRATVTDAFYLDYNPYVIRECVATNSETVNEVHLTDIDKYLGKVIDMDTFSKLLESGQL